MFYGGSHGKTHKALRAFNANVNLRHCADSYGWGGRAVHCTDLASRCRLNYHNY